MLTASKCEKRHGSQKQRWQCLIILNKPVQRDLNAVQGGNLYGGLFEKSYNQRNNHKNELFSKSKIFFWIPSHWTLLKRAIVRFIPTCDCGWHAFFFRGRTENREKPWKYENIWEMLDKSGLRNSWKHRKYKNSFFNSRTVPASSSKIAFVF